MDLHVTPRITIGEAELEERFIAAAGPGGQNVNKVATAVQLRFDAARSPAIGAAMLARLGVLAGRRMTGAGVVVIAANQFRTQERNRADARERLAALIRQAAVPPTPRFATRPTLGSRAAAAGGQGGAGGCEAGPRPAGHGLARDRGALRHHAQQGAPRIHHHQVGGRPRDQRSPRSGRPRYWAGMVESRAAASSRPIPRVSRLRRAWSIVSTLPARVPSARRTVSCRLKMACRPSRYSPSGIPAAATASVTPYNPGIARRAASTAPGATWCRSKIISAWDAWLSAHPAHPGAR